ncbi:YfhO family protein [Porcipelethomonas sp.]|uniref:YfhO family protein n=1 Tax=Porcipelethomonas sp. TaxID=2981675 RepID=UPI003EF1A0F3
MTAKRIYGIILPPVITLIIIGIFFMIFGIFPFGSRTISWCDMNQQTVPLLMDLKDILDGKGSIIYSTGNAGGMNFWGVFLFFIASPLYLTVKFVEKSHIIYLVNILFAVKLALAALTAAIYFKYAHKKLNIKGVIVLSVMYALCGYSIMYYQTLVWLDIMYLFPLLVLSVERMCIRQKPAMYCTVLTVMTAINYYLSFMVVIYIMLAVPLFIAMRCPPKSRKTASLLFIMTSFVSMLLTAPVWLCSFLQVSESARGENTLSGLLYKSMFENTGNKFCVIMSTGICLVVIPFLIKNKICRKKNVRYNIVMLILLAVPVFLDPVNKIWHTGSYQSFPMRYGFIIIFTMLTLTAYYLESVEECKKGSPGFTVTLLILILCCFAVCIYTVLSKKQILLSYINTLRVDREAFKILISLAVFACLMYIICFMMSRQKFISSNMFYLFISMVFITEFTVSATVNIGYAANDGDLFKNSAVLENKSQSNELTRVKSEKKYLHVNMLGGLGYDSAAHYTSLTSEQYMYTMKKMGYSSYWMEVGSNGGTCLTDAWLSVKYSIGSYFDFKSYHKMQDTKGALKIAENTICCPAGIAGNKTPQEIQNLDFTDRFSIQCQIAENIFGTDEMLHKYSISYTDNGQVIYNDGKYSITADDPDMSLCQIRYSAKVTGRQILYFDIFDTLSNRLSEDYYNSAKIYVNGNCLTSSYPTQKNNGLFCLGEFENETAEIMIIMTRDVSVKSFGVFGIDTDKLKSCTEQADGCTLSVNKNTVSAEYNSPDDKKYLYMAVPFEKGLTAYINGHKTELYRINDDFCAVRLEKGQNNIELKFVPPGMIAGIIMTLSGILICILWRAKGKHAAVKIKCLKTISFILCSACFYGTLFTVYIMPVALRLAVKISSII